MRMAVRTRCDPSCIFFNARVREAPVREECAGLGGFSVDSENRAAAVKVSAFRASIHWSYRLVRIVSFQPCNIEQTVCKLVHFDVCEAWADVVATCSK